MCVRVVRVRAWASGGWGGTVGVEEDGGADSHHVLAGCSRVADLMVLVDVRVWGGER